jgi:hypothetical protein
VPSAEHAVPALGTTLGQLPLGVKHVHTGPTNVPQLHTVPSGNAHALGPDAQLDPSAGGEDGQPAGDGHGP